MLLFTGDDGKLAVVVPATTSLYTAKPSTPGRRGVSPRAQARAASARSAKRNSARTSKQQQTTEKRPEVADALGVDARKTTTELDSARECPKPTATPEPAANQMEEEVVEEPDAIDG